MIDFNSDSTTTAGTAFLPEFHLKLRGRQHQEQQQHQQQQQLPLQQRPNRAIEMMTESYRCTDSIDGGRTTYQPLFPSRCVTNAASARQSPCAAAAATGMTTNSGTIHAGSLSTAFAFEAARELSRILRRQNDFVQNGVLTMSLLNPRDIQTLAERTLPRNDYAHGHGCIPQVGNFSEIDVRDILLQRKMRILELHREHLLHQHQRWEQQRQQEKQPMRQELFEQQQRNERRLQEVSDRNRNSTAEAESNSDSVRNQRDPDGDDLYAITRPEPQVSQGQDEEKGNDEDENRGVECVQVPLRVESNELVGTYYTGD